MSIRRRLSSTSFRFVGLYVLVYLLTTLGFMVLMFSILGTEIEDNIKSDIKRDFREIVATVDPEKPTDIEHHISGLIAEANPLETVYILKTQQGKVLSSNYPYETSLDRGWIHLREIQKEDEPQGFDDDEDSFWEDIDLYPKNAHDEGYVGWNDVLGPYVLYIGQSLERIEETKSIVSGIAVLVVPISLFLAFLGGLIFNRMTTKRIEVINDHCRSIRSQGDLSLRVPNSRPDDDYGLLIANLNAMLDTIDKGVQNVQAVSDDVAHDLRTPLSRLKYQLESGLADPKANTESLKSILKEALQETDGLLETFSAILRISQLNSGRRNSKFQNFDLFSVVETFYEAYAPSAEEAGHLIAFVPNTPSCVINGDKEMVGQLLSNLIENALQHGSGPDQKNITITLGLHCDDYETVLSVEDNGRGIDPAYQDQVFTKFYRGDYSRSGAGNGLGLAMVKAVADLHNAKVQLVTLNPGVKFLVIFPRVS